MLRLLRMVMIVVALAGTGFIVYKSAQPVVSPLTPAFTSPTTERVQPASDEATPTPISSLDGKAIAEEVKALNIKGAAQLLRGAGWFHLLVRYDSEQDSAGVFPDGKPIPLHYEMDQWFQLNDQKQVIAVVVLGKDLQGQIQQVSTFHSSHWRNLTFGTDNEGTAELYLDFGFGREIEMAAERGYAITRIDDSSTDRSIIHYVFGSDLDQPLVVAGMADPVLGSQKWATYDLDTGQLLAIEIHYLMADRQERVDRTTIMIAEMVSEPPPDILKALDQEIEQ
jgi:hypothetical protein